MTKRDFLDDIYKVDSPDAQRQVYDDWARTYDAELGDAGYATPGRVAAMLIAHHADPARPVLDFGCGTGLSGHALAKAGFTTIDGCDVSDGMLSQARATGVYRRLWQADGATGLTQRYPAIAAAGAISNGAAPASVMDGLVAALTPGGLFAFSFNDHTMDDPDYTGRLAALTGPDGPCRIVAQERGAHLPKIGLEATVFLIRRQ